HIALLSVGNYESARDTIGWARIAVRIGAGVILLGSLIMLGGEVACAGGPREVGRLLASIAALLLAVGLLMTGTRVVLEALNTRSLDVGVLILVSILSDVSLVSSHSLLVIFLAIVANSMRRP